MPGRRLLHLRERALRVTNRSWSPHFLWSCPETEAGGFSHIDGTVEFFSRIQALLPDQGIVLDLGAGRGKWQEDSCEWRRRLADLRGGNRFVIAADIDDSVTGHGGVDSAVLLPPEGGLPFRDASIAMVVADWVFEHIGDPGVLATELSRVVSPGGWVCARTPNKWGYVGLGARVVPNGRHVAILSRLQPQRREEDVFSVEYRLNTTSAIRAAFWPDVWLHCTYFYNPDPDYVGRSRLARSIINAWQWASPRPLSTALHVFLQRRQDDSVGFAREGLGFLSRRRSAGALAMLTNCFARNDDPPPSDAAS